MHGAERERRQQSESGGSSARGCPSVAQEGRQPADLHISEWLVVSYRYIYNLPWGKVRPSPRPGPSSHVAKKGLGAAMHLCASSEAMTDKHVHAAFENSLFETST
jgi:hypothetical protein